MRIRGLPTSFSSFATHNRLLSSNISLRKTLTIALLLSSSSSSYFPGRTNSGSGSLLNCIQAVEISSSTATSSCSASSASAGLCTRSKFPRPTAIVAARVDADGGISTFATTTTGGGHDPTSSTNTNNHANENTPTFRVRDLLSFKGINKSKPLTPNDFLDKVVLIVNTASLCGYTPQLKDLQALQDRYSSQGFTVVGLPCNDFGEQEPWTEDKVLEFYQSKYNVQFPLTSKVRIGGGEPHPLYRYLLTTLGDVAVPPWNFHKILLSRQGDIVGLFPPDLSPTSSDITKVIEQELGVKK